MDGIEIIFDYDEEKIRLDKGITLCAPDFTRSEAQKLISEGLVCVDGVARPKDYILKQGQKISIFPKSPAIIEARPENIPLDVRFEDDDLLVVNKPKGMVVHPAPGNYTATLVNALLYHCGDSLSGINGAIRPGIVHRIDKDTSGLLIVAKNDRSHKILAQQIKNHNFTREYKAIVHGNLKQDFGTVNAPIGRSIKDRKKMAVTFKNSKHAVTHFEVEAHYDNFTALKLTLETGRTHQIRVHMAHIGHPVAGDRVYGFKNIGSGLEGQCLHASKIGFIHPKTGNYLEIESELPDYFEEFVKCIRACLKNKTSCTF